MGVVPILGAGTNLFGAFGSAWKDSDAGRTTNTPAVGLAGAAANVAGTVTGVVGLLTGNHTALSVGAGLLGVSGLAGSYMAIRS